jgi:hypothetical protein
MAKPNKRRLLDGEPDERGEVISENSLFPFRRVVLMIDREQEPWICINATEYLQT